MREKPMNRRRLFLCAIFFTLLTVVGNAQVMDGMARRTSFNDDWRFLKGDAAVAELPAFNDSRWRTVQLPHDWAIEGPFDPKFNPHEGALPDFGTGWYRKHFTMPVSAKGK